MKDEFCFWVSLCPCHFESRCDQLGAVLSGYFVCDNNLYTSYAVHAAEEITGRSGIWHVFLDRCGEDFLAASFHDEAVSREQLFLNSWQSALYRGLEEHIDFVTQWLRL